MKKTFGIMLFLLMTIISLVVPAVMAFETVVEKHGGSHKAAPQKLIDMVPGLAKYGTDPVIVDAVRKKNSQNQSKGDITALDKKWKSTAGTADFMRAMMTSAAGQRLAEIKKAQPAIEEAYVLDNKGANVAIGAKTEAYWHGDEEKFTTAWNGGLGKIRVGDVEFDENCQTYVAEVSVPVVDGGRVIGVLVFEIDADKCR